MRVDDLLPSIEDWDFSFCCPEAAMMSALEDLSPGELTTLLEEISSPVFDPGKLHVFLEEGMQADSEEQDNLRMRMFTRAKTLLDWLERDEPMILKANPADLKFPAILCGPPVSLLDSLPAVGSVPDAYVWDLTNRWYKIESDEIFLLKLTPHQWQQGYESLVQLTLRSRCEDPSSLVRALRRCRTSSELQHWMRECAAIF